MSGENKTRANRVQMMLGKKNEMKPFVPRVESSLTNRFFNLFSNKKPLPQGTFKKTPMKGGMKNYNKRALNFLSQRSLNVATRNLQKLTSARNRKTLTQALNKTRRKR